MRCPASKKREIDQTRPGCVSWRRTLALLPLWVTLAGCIPEAAVTLSGPGRVISDRPSVCKIPPGRIFFDLPEELELNIRASVSDGYSDGYTLNVDLQNSGGNWQKPRVAPEPKVYLLSSAAIVSGIAQPVPMGGLDGKSGPRLGGYHAKAETAEAAAARMGKSLLSIDLGSNASLDYYLPSFSGLSTKITLPALLINGKRFDVPPITLSKSLSYIGMCPH
jgi:hypothetical protein